MLARPKVRRIRRCAWCGRAKHTDGSPHGRALQGDERDAAVRRQAALGVSHGICNDCWTKVVARC